MMASNIAIMEAETESTTISLAELEVLAERVRNGMLANGDLEIIEQVIRLFVKISVKAQEKKSSITQIRAILFGDKKSEKTANHKETDEQEKDSSIVEPPLPRTEPKPKKSGHGRNPASAYTGAKIIQCQDIELQPDAPCPDKLCQGHLQQFYREFAPFIRLEGQPGDDAWIT